MANLLLDTIDLLKFHAVQEAFGMINGGWSPPAVLQHFALTGARRPTDMRFMLPAPQHEPKYCPAAQISMGNKPMGNPAPTHAHPLPSHAQAQTAQTDSQSTQVKAERILSRMDSRPGEAYSGPQSCTGIYEEMHRRFKERGLAKTSEATSKPNEPTFEPEQSQEPLSDNKSVDLPASERQVEQQVKVSPEAGLPGIVESIENKPAEKTTKSRNEQVLGPRCQACKRSKVSEGPSRSTGRPANEFS